ncbi:UvrD-helicase domain-containing protein [Bacteroidia bacterium]|nr:UvrD-helicase domain-containing protein [Bacteroidia bacterium]
MLDDFDEILNGGKENNDSPPYLDGLNGAQKDAVLQTDGPVMIIAGAGSGKTRVLTYRIAHLIRKGTEPFKILSLTFTNKAAREMRERIEAVVGPEAKNVWMGTFHSIFARILRQEAETIGYPQSFTIYDSDDSKSLIKAILKEKNMDDKMYKPGMMLSRISAAKTNLVTPKDYRGNEDLLEKDRQNRRSRFHELYSAYQERCYKAGAMDFDDILVNTFYLFKNHPKATYKWQHRFKYVMVDEYQDTNHVQYMITRRLAAVNQNICVVGDDAQSIYAFRGANIQNILNFTRDYPDCKTYKLEQNYRSSKNIVNAASSVIKNNEKQLEKKVWTQNDTGDKIKIVRNITEAEEARYVAQSIFEDKNQDALPNKAFAILYRTNSQSRTFEEALRRLGIDYKIYGGTSFYQRKEIKDMLAYLRLLVNPKDEAALKRIINYPTRGIGNTTFNKLQFLSQQQERPMWEVLAEAENFPELSGATLTKLKNFYMMIEGFGAMQKDKDAYEISSAVAKNSGLLKFMYSDKTVEGVSRYENLLELLDSIKEFVEDDENEKEKTLANFLEEVALYTDIEKNSDPNRDCVHLMTVHASKGLEFPNIYIVGMEENLFPSQMSLMSRKDLEEERRLFYVAITRAERKVHVTFATSRFRYGNLTPCEPSRFIDEIDSEFVDMDLAGLKKESPMVSSNQKSQATRSSVLLKNYSHKSTSHPIDPNFKEGDVSGMKVGDKIQHIRFGYGQVLDLDGNGPNKKARIDFEKAGEKTLVVKFAKMRMV